VLPARARPDTTS